MRQQSSTEKNRVEEIHPDRLLPRVPLHVVDDPFRPIDAGVVHENIYSREAFERVADETLDVRRHRHVCDRSGDRRRLRCNRLELALCTVEVGGIPGADEDARAGCEVRPCNLEPETMAPARDDCRSALRTAVISTCCRL